MSNLYFVYILCSKRNGTLYIGMTNEFAKRMIEHREGLADGFTKKHNVKTLVYLETYQDVTEARHQEKCLKRWKRDWKLELIEANNPLWNDLYDSIQV